MEEFREARHDGQVELFTPAQQATVPAPERTGPRIIRRRKASPGHRNRPTSTDDNS